MFNLDVIDDNYKTIVRKLGKLKIPGTENVDEMLSFSSYHCMVSFKICLCSQWLLSLVNLALGRAGGAKQKNFATSVTLKCVANASPCFVNHVKHVSVHFSKSL